MSASPAGGAGAAGAGQVVRAAHLRKLKTMKKKFFVLRAETPECSARLEYYESEKKFRAGATPRRVIPLKSCYNITRRLDLKQKHVIALFTREEQFCIVAENEIDLHEWLTAILKHHRNDDASEELLHPIQHVWQVNVQKKGLGASKNIQGLYNLCLTDKTLTLVKIKSHNNVISDLVIPERVEYSLKNIRRCGDSECFFYMEVGRSTSTGAGELWMHSDDSNIAQSMHSTIYHAMRNCAKETENERDHIIVPKTSESTLPARRQTYSDGRGRAGLSNEKGLCVGSCIRQCVCATTYSVDDSAAAVAPLATHAENQPPNNSLTEQKEHPHRIIKHHRTVSLPTGCPLFQEPLKIVHERTRSAPLTGDEVDRAFLEKATTHSSCKTVNGTDAFGKKSQWSRRASTGTRLSKLSPAHSKNAGTLRNRCDSMPSRASSSFEAERPPQRHPDIIDGLEISRDDLDSVEWHRTPRIPEEPDFCEPIRDLMSTSLRSSIQHSRTSSIGVEDIALEAIPVPDGYLPMAPGHEPLGGLVSASSGSVCSGTPSTDPRFSEYQLEPATSHIVDVERPPRAYSVGSRPAPRAEAPRHRAYSVGARNRPPPPSRHQPTAVSSAPLLPRASAEDLMELDFSKNSPAAKVVVARTPPAAGFMESRRAVDEYVDMSPRNNAGYVEMRPGELAPLSRSPPAAASGPPPAAPATPDGYVEMNYGRAPTRPIAIANARAPPPIATSPDDRRRRPPKESRTPLGSQTIFPLSLDSPASPPELDPSDAFEDDPPHHPLTTVREISEDGSRQDGRRSPEVSSSPSYVKLAYGSKPIAAPAKAPEARPEELSCNPTATKALARDPDGKGDAFVPFGARHPAACARGAFGPAGEAAAGDADCERARLRTDAALPAAEATLVLAGGGTAARFSVGGSSPPPTAPAAPPVPLNYAALDLEPRAPSAAPPARTYTQIDFARSEKLHADAN